MNIHPPAFPPPTSASVILPDEIIMEILSRLNVKSLMTLKCVCKSWNNLISDPIFIKMHLNLSKRNPHLALLSVGFPNDYTVAVASIPVTRLLESTSNTITLTNDPYYQFSYPDWDGILGSCNGLICLHAYYFPAWCQKHYFCFWNPATRTESKTLLSLDSLAWCQAIRFGFGYDNSTDRYKAVTLGFNIFGGALVTTTVKVFILGDNIWRDIQSFFPVEVALCSILDEVKYDGVYLSNSISWLVQKNLTTQKFVIVSLDLGTETFTQLSLPRCCDELPLDNSTLRVLMDCICFSHDFGGTHLVIWQMKEFGVEESWTQLLKISYLNLKINYILGDDGFQLLPLCLSEIDATLILATNSRKRNQAILYNWRDNRVKKIGTTNGIWWCAAKDYVESLVLTC